MRLIDADNLIEIIKNIQDHMREANKKPVPVDAREIWTLFIDMVEKQPIAYDVIDVIKELDELRAKPTELVYDVPLVNSIIDIVRKGGINNNVN